MDLTDFINEATETARKYGILQARMKVVENIVLDEIKTSDYPNRIAKELAVILDLDVKEGKSDVDE